MLRRPAIFTGLLVAGWLAFTAWCDLAGERKLKAGGLAEVTQPVSIDVTLAFAPEEFHMTRLQQAGRLLGVEGRTVRLGEVSRAAATAIAREYWVRAIRRDDVE
jgi:hypothetical protein